MQIRNPKYASENGEVIDCEISINNEWLPFTANAKDKEAHGKAIYQSIKNGEHGAIAAYVPPPPVVPSVVSMRQARLALLQAGLLGAVDAAINDAGQAAIIEWEYAQELRRTHPLTLSLAAELDLSEQQLDELFTAAAAL